MEMEQQQVLRLRQLCLLEIDAYLCYKHSVDGMQVGPARKKLAEFLAEHFSHVEELSAALRQAGQVPPAFNPEGRFRKKQGVVVKKLRMAEAFGEWTVLKAMRLNELETNKAYDDALGKAGFTEDTLEMVKRLRDDERRHLKELEKQLAERVHQEL